MSEPNTEIEDSRQVFNLFFLLETVVLTKTKTTKTKMFTENIL